MIKYLLLLCILALRIVYQPGHAQTTLAPFTTHFETGPASPPAKLLTLDGRISDKKIILDWTVGENETADQFEVEKSMDGKNFKMAALVFGTDRPEKGVYQFYEKAGNQKMSYRIKLINKNRQTEYSAIITINPTT